MLAATLERVLGGFDTHDLQPLAGEHLGDAGAHRAQADHAHRAELPAHGRSALIAGSESPRALLKGRRRPPVSQVSAARHERAHRGKDRMEMGYPSL